jgi:aminoglycoside phosphotransferase (APT) family kinase protein
MTIDIQNCLQAYCAQLFPSKKDVQVRDINNITAGWESEMYAFDVEYGPAEARQRQPLVLRIYPGEDAYFKSAREFEGMRNLYQAGYPVPEVMLLEREASPFGKPFVIMERINGQSLWDMMSHSPAQEQDKLMSLFCELYVRLHRLDWRPFADEATRAGAGDPYFFIDQFLNMAHNSLERFPNSRITDLAESLQALRDEVPCQLPAVIHGDFHPNNLLVRQDGSASVIDWSGVRVLTYSYLGKAWRDHILQGYERFWGAKVEQIETFELIAGVRRLFDVTVSLSEGPEKLGMRPGAVMQMRQELEPLGRIYEKVVAKTGVRIEEVENLLRSG